jgi:hypothetical protein
MLEYLLDLLKKFGNTLYDMLKDFVAWLFDSILSLINTILSTLPAIDFSTFNPGTYFAAFPASLTNMLHYLHVDAALGIIVSALVIRLLLQLIPMTRLGS